MSKSIGIIYSDLHPLIVKVGEFTAQRGYEVEFVPWQSIVYHHADSTLDRFGIVYLDRMGEMTRSYATQIRAAGLGCKTKVVNSPEAYLTARDKALTAFALAGHQILTPATTLCFSLETLLDQTQKDLTYVAKSTLGCCAEDILVFSGHDIPVEKLTKLLERDAVVCLQPYVLNPDRFIWRVDVVNDEVIVCNQRFSYLPDGLPVCNGTQGGRVVFLKPEDLPDNVRSTALNAMKALSLKVGGVDILPDGAGNLYVLEVNPEPDITLDRYEFPQAIADYLISEVEGATP